MRRMLVVCEWSIATRASLLQGESPAGAATHRNSHLQGQPPTRAATQRGSHPERQSPREAVTHRDRLIYLILHDCKQG